MLQLAFTVPWPNHHALLSGLETRIFFYLVSVIPLSYQSVPILATFLCLKGIQITSTCKTLPWFCILLRVKEKSTYHNFQNCVAFSLSFSDSVPALFFNTPGPLQPCCWLCTEKHPFLSLSTYALGFSLEVLLPQNPYPPSYKSVFSRHIYTLSSFLKLFPSYKLFPIILHHFFHPLKMTLS